VTTSAGPPAMLFDLDVLNASHLFRLLARKLFTQETL
jgi:hypothetical protein